MLWNTSKWYFTDIIPLKERYMWEVEHNCLVFSFRCILDNRITLHSVSVLTAMVCFVWYALEYFKILFNVTKVYTYKLIGSIFKISTQITNHWYNLNTDILRGKSDFLMQFIFYVKTYLKTFSRFQLILQCGWSCNQKGCWSCSQSFLYFLKSFPLGLRACKY